MATASGAADARERLDGADSRVDMNEYHGVSAMHLSWADYAASLVTISAGVLFIRGHTQTLLQLPG